MEAHHIRRSRPEDCPELVGLWERAVRATHGFLTEADIAFYRPLTAQILAADSLELWVLVDSSNVTIGFLGLSENAIEALFLEPARRRHGYGRRLVEHAQQLRGGALTVDVNEEMPRPATSTRRSDSWSSADRHSMAPATLTRCSTCAGKRKACRPNHRVTAPTSCTALSDSRLPQPSAAR